MKGKLITLTALGMALLVAMFAFGYAWFADVGTAKKAEFGVLQIDSTISLYRALDVNFNGVPDTLSSYGQSNGYYKAGDDWTLYSVLYYAETYAFELIDDKFILSTETTDSEFSEIQITDAEPSRIYTFKGVIVNYSGKDVTVEFAFEEVESDRLSDFEWRIVYATETKEKTDTSGNTSTFTYVDDEEAPWSSAENFGNWTDFDASGTTLFSNLYLGWTNDDDKFDFWLQLRMKSTATEPLSGALTLPFVVTVSIG